MVIFQEAHWEALVEQKPPDNTLFFTLVRGLGGALTEIRQEYEVVRFGYPEKPESQWFQVWKDPGKKRHHAATEALERIVFARRIGRIILTEPQWEAMVRRGIAIHHETSLATCQPEQAADFFR